MSKGIYAAALLFAVLLLAAAPVLTGFSADARAQGYAGVLPSDQNEGGDDKGALPFMSSQMGQKGGQEAGGHATVTGSGKEEAGGDQATGGFEMDGDGLKDDASLAADGGDPGDMSDIYGLKRHASQDEDKANSAPQGFLAAFANDKPKDEMDPANDPVPDNMYRAMESESQDPNEQRRIRVQRAVKAAEAKRMKDIEDMNAERMRDHQIQAQGELDRIMGQQEEAMAKLGLTQESSGPDDQNDQTKETADDNGGADGAGAGSE